MYGAITCDALGGSVQFKKRGTFPPVTGLQPIMHFSKPAGYWSDDSSLTLCVAMAFIENSGLFRARIYVDNMVTWLRNGYLSSDDHAWDIGQTTQDAIKIWVGCPSSNINDTQRIVDRDLKTEQTAGNGSLMRVAPVALALWRTPQMAIRVAREQSDVTHPWGACSDACALYTILICRIMAGRTTKTQLAALLHATDISDRILRERLARYTDLAAWQAKPQDRIKSTGWVIDTIEAALWGFFTTNDFRTGALKVVNLGLDTDSIGAVYGGIAGAFYGVEAVPEEWRTGIAKPTLVANIVDRFVKVGASTKARRSGNK